VGFLEVEGRANCGERRVERKLCDRIDSSVFARTSTFILRDH